MSAWHTRRRRGRGFERAVQSVQSLLRGQSHKEVFVLRGFDRIDDAPPVRSDIRLRVYKNHLQPALARTHLHQTPVCVDAHHKERARSRVIINLRIVRRGVVSSQRYFRQPQISTLAIKIIRDDRSDEETAPPQIERGAVEIRTLPAACRRLDTESRHGSLCGLQRRFELQQFQPVQRTAGKRIPQQREDVFYQSLLLVPKEFLNFLPKLKIEAVIPASIFF
jgi:hypothetical protein